MRPSTDVTELQQSPRSAKPLPRWALGALFVVALVILGYALYSFMPQSTDDAVDVGPGMIEPRPAD